MNINADNIKAENLSLITDKVELLAYKIAGLTYTSGDTIKIAEDFRELFVETFPEGANIYINGVRKGVSPDLFEQIPLGFIRIEAEKDNLYGRVDIHITEDTNSVTIDLKETYGNLFIKTGYKDLNVYLDGILLGIVDSGFFADISVGGHDLVLEGDGYFWRGFVSVSANKSTTVEVELRAYGSLLYNIPDGAVAEITNDSVFLQSLTKSGDIALWSEEYIIKVSGDDFETEEFSIFISKGDKYNFNPILKHNREYIARKNRQGKVIRLEEIRTRRTEIEDEIVRLNHVKDKKHIGGWVSAGSSVLSASLFGLFSIFGNSAYDDYMAATITADAVEYKDKFQLWDTLSYVSLGTSVATAGLSAYLFLSKSNIEGLNQEYVSLGIEMARLEGELQ